MITRIRNQSLPDQPIPDSAKEVSGVLIKLKSPQAGGGRLFERLPVAFP